MAAEEQTPVDPWGTHPSTFRQVALAILNGADDGDPAAIVNALLASDLDPGDLTLIVTCLLVPLAHAHGANVRAALLSLFDALPSD